MKKRPQNDDSDEFDVDEPEEFEESGSDWDPEDDDSNSKKRKSRGGGGGGKGSSKKSPNKKKKSDKEPSDDEEDEENEEEDEEGEEEEESEDEGSGQEQGGANGTNVPLKAFTNGSFVILKTDLQADGNPPIWKIDGKALLQKYVPFTQDGKTLYKNTSTYSGWTQSNRNQYAAAPVTYVQQGKKEIIIEFNKDKVRLDEEQAAADGAKNEAQAATA